MRPNYPTITGSFNTLLAVHTSHPQKPHPVLGWIPVEMNRETYAHTEFSHVGHLRPVLLYGDPFAQCATPDGTCFQYFLNTDKDFPAAIYFLNYGVGGYGFDEIFPPLKNSVHLFEAPFLWLIC